MPLNLGLLSEAGMVDLPEATRDELQKQATKQFIVGSLLGGDPSMAFRSAIDVPNQYVSSQQRQLSLQKAREEQDQLSQFRSQFVPTQTDANARESTARSVMSDIGLPNQGAGLSQQLQSRPVDVDAALRAALGMSGNPAQSRIVENLKAMTPQFRPEIGAFTTAGGRVTGTVPIADKSGVTKQYNPSTGQWEFGVGQNALSAVSAVEGATQGAKSAAENQYNFQPITLPDGSTVLQSRTSLAEMEKMRTRAEGDVAGLQREIGRLKPNDTTTKPILEQELRNAQERLRSLGAGIQSAPSTAQTTANELYKPILNDAYAAYKTASSRAPTLDSLKLALNNPAFDTNAFTGAKTQLTAFLNAAGVTGEQQNSYLNSANAFRQGLNTIAAQSIRENPGAVSNFDISFGQSQFATMTDPKKSNQFAVDLMTEKDKRNKEFYNFVQANKTADVLEKWQASPRGSESLFEAPSLRKYLPQLQVTSGPNKGQTAYQLPNGKYKTFPN